MDNRCFSVGRDARRSSRVFDIFRTLWARKEAVCAYTGCKCIVLWVGVDTDENSVTERGEYSLMRSSIACEVGRRIATQPAMGMINLNPNI